MHTQRSHTRINQIYTPDNPYTHTLQSKLNKTIYTILNSNSRQYITFNNHKKRIMIVIIMILYYKIILIISSSSSSFHTILFVIINVVTTGQPGTFQHRGQRRTLLVRGIKQE
jgi:hypothetical protein